MSDTVVYFSHVAFRMLQSYYTVGQSTTFITLFLKMPFYYCSLKTNDNLRKEPKFIAFLTQILLLFKFCNLCKSENPVVKASNCGTMLVVKSHCINPNCMHEELWRSQPQMPGTRIAAGNFLLSMATLFAGGSISKVLQICKHMGLCSVSLVTFFNHQKVCYHFQ